MIHRMNGGFRRAAAAAAAMLQAQGVITAVFQGSRAVLGGCGQEVLNSDTGGEREAYRAWVRRYKWAAACKLRLKHQDARTSKGSQHPEGRWDTKSSVRCARPPRTVAVGVWSGIRRNIRLPCWPDVRGPR